MVQRPNPLDNQVYIWSNEVPAHFRKAMPSARKPAKRAVLISHGIVMAFIILVGLSSYSGLAHTRDLIYAFSLLIVILFFWSLWSWKASTGRLFDGYTIFLWSAFMFNGGLALLEAMGFSDYGISNGRFGAHTNIFFSRDIIGSTLFLVLLGMAATHLGALLEASRKHKLKRRQRRWHLASPTLTNLQIVGGVLATISIIPTYLTLTNSIAIRLTQSYGTLYQSDRISGIDNWPIVLSGFFAPGVIFLLAGSKGRKVNLVIALVCISVLTLAGLFVGTRSYAIMPLIAFAWVWHTCIRRLPILLLLSMGGLTLFVVFPLISYTRQGVGLDYVSLASLRDAYGSLDNPAISIIHEMGASVYTISGTLEMVPATRPFDFGVGYIHALLNLIPNFVAPLKFDLSYGTPDVWFVNTFDSGHAAMGGGLGFSFIAEAYLAFGWTGAPLILAVIGSLLAKLFTWATRAGEPAKIAAAAACLCFILHYPRGMAEAYIRSLVLYAFVPYLLTHLLAHYRQTYRGEKS